MTKTKEILMRRDGYTSEEADAVMDETSEAIWDALENGDDPEQILAEELGLEPDYIFDFI